MKRRALLGTVAGVAATAGCLDAVPVVGGEPPLELRVRRVDVRPADAGPEEVTWPTNVTCRLPEAFVEEHDALRRLLRSAADRPTGEWVTAGVSREVGDDVVAGLEANCADSGGLNFYDGEPYWISVQFTDAADAAAHHSGDGHNHTHGGG